MLDYRILDFKRDSQGAWYAPAAFMSLIRLVREAAARVGFQPGPSPSRPRAGNSSTEVGKPVLIIRRVRLTALTQINQVLYLLRRMRVTGSSTRETSYAVFPRNCVSNPSYNALEDILVRTRSPLSISLSLTRRISYSQRVQHVTRTSAHTTSAATPDAASKTRMTRQTPLLVCTYVTRYPSITNSSCFPSCSSPHRFAQAESYIESSAYQTSCPRSLDIYRRQYTR